MGVGRVTTPTLALLAALPHLAAASVPESGPGPGRSAESIVTTAHYGRMDDMTDCAKAAGWNR